VTRLESGEPPTVVSKIRRGVTRFLFPVLIVLGSVLAAGAWIVSSPSGGGPDDVMHNASIWCPSPAGKYCAIVGYSNNDPNQPNKPIVEVPARLVQAACFAYYPKISAACLNDVPLNGMTRSDDPDNGRYPGPYYRIMHVFASSSAVEFDRMVLLVRTANVLIAALFFIGVAWLLPWSMRRLLVYTMIGLSVPLVIYMLTSVNPTAWGITGVMTVWFALTGLFATAGDPSVPRWRRRALAGMAVAAAALAASARTDCAAFCFVAVLAVGAFHLPQLNPRRWRPHRLTWAAMIAVTIIGILGTFSGSQTSALGCGLSCGSHTNLITRALLFYNIEHLPALFQGFWTVALGWFDVPMLPITTSLVTLIGFGLFYLGFRRMSVPKAVAAGGVLLGLVVMSLYMLQIGGDKVGTNMQPRYLAPLILMIAAIMLSRRRCDGARRLSSAQTWAAYVCLVVAHSFALHSLIQRYTMGVDEMTQNLNRVIEWWRPGLPSPMAVWLLGSLGFAGLALLLFVVRRKNAERSPAGAGTE